MNQAQELRDEVGRVGRLLDAGHRGVPIGGELVIAFGATFAVLGGMAGASAFGYLPVAWTPSPLAAAGAFLAFSTLFRRLTGGLLAVAAVAAAAAGEAAWRAALLTLPAKETPGSAAVMAVVAAPVLLIALGSIIGLWRLKQNAHAGSPANRALIAVWLGLAAAMAATIALCAILGARSGNWFGFMLLPGLFWTLWGAGWWASGAMTLSRWMYVVATGSWTLALFYAATSYFYSTSIVGFSLLAVAPGLRLLREARATHEA